MTKSNIPTSHILVRATSSFDGEPCDFALFDVSPTELGALNRCLAAANQSELTDIPEYNSVTFFYNIEGFFKVGEGCSEDKLRQLLQGAEWAFVDITDEERLELEEVESAVENQKIEIWPSGAFRFTAIGDDTETQFKTSELSLKEIESYFQ